MKQTALADRYRGQTLSNEQLSSIMKDMSSGITEEVIIKRYKLRTSQYREVKTYYKEVTGPGATNKKKEVKDNRLDLDVFKSKSGAGKQGLNETCLCGSGRKYRSCCVNKR